MYAYIQTQVYNTYIYIYVYMTWLGLTWKFCFLFGPKEQDKKRRTRRRRCILAYKHTLDISSFFPVLCITLSSLLESQTLVCKPTQQNRNRTQHTQWTMTRTLHIILYYQVSTFPLSLSFSLSCLSTLNNLAQLFQETQDSRLETRTRVKTPISPCVYLHESQLRTLYIYTYTST